MRRVQILAATGVALLVATTAPSAPAQPRQMGGVGLTVFADANYRGRNATFRQDVPNLGAYDLNDRVSSLTVAPGELWEVCQHADYSGRCQVFSGTEPDLRQSGWNDIISSVRRVRGGGGVRPPIVPPIGSGQLALYSDTRFAGDRRVITSAEPDLGRVGFNNRAESLRLSRGQAWEVCSQANYRDCLVVNTDWSDLSGLGLSRRISSVRPWGSGGGIGPGPIGPMRLVLFDERGYRGRAFTIDRAQSSLSSFTNRAQSAQVVGGTWEICERPGFGGRCATVTSNVSDLAVLGLRNRVASARLLRSPR